MSHFQSKIYLVIDAGGVVASGIDSVPYPLRPTTTGKRGFFLRANL
jgi:hypothetical protein